uniref:transposase n=1 Tax=Pseudorhodobacter aquimaris TaxID=687412 RepID=UPI0038CDA20D
MAYLSRYTHSVAISNSGLIRFDARSVIFRAKGHRLKGAGRHTTMTLTMAGFIRRFLIHVLPKGQHRIPHYGFFGNGSRAANIARIRQLLGVRISEHDHDNNTGNTVEPVRFLALPCPCCGG